MESFNEFIGKTLSGDVLSFITAGGILFLSVIIVATIIIFRRWNGRVVPFLFGIVTYGIFGFIFSQLVVSALAMIPSIDYAFSYNQSAYNLVQAIFLAIGMGIARWFILKMMISRYERPGDVYLAGLGIGIGQGIFSYGLSIFAFYVNAQVLINQGEVTTDFISGLTEGLTEANITSLADTFSQLFYAPETIWALLGLAAVLDLFLNLFLMVATFGAMKKNINYMWSWYVIAIQLVSILSFTVYDYRSVTSITISFIVKTIVTIGAIIVINKVSKAIEYSKE